MEKLFIFYKYLQLLGGILWLILPQLAVCGIFVLAIIAFIDTVWLERLVLIIFSGVVLYSLYIQIGEHVEKETIKAIKKLEKQKAEIAKGTYKGGLFVKEPTLKEGIRNWAKAIFWLGLFLLALKFF